MSRRAVAVGTLSAASGSTMLDLEVDRNDLHRMRAVETPAAPLEPGEARLAIDRFGLTANNITYAVFGDAMGYWQFFPATAESGTPGDGFRSGGSPT